MIFLYFFNQLVQYIVVGWRWLNAGCPPKPLCHFPLQLDKGEKM